MNSFTCEYQAEQLEDWPSKSPDLVLSPSWQRGAERLIEVGLSDGSSWTVSVATDPDAPARAISGLFATPSPSRLCVIARGAAYLLDTVSLANSQYIETGGAITSIRRAFEEKLLLLCTDWAVVAIGEAGLLWRTPRLAIEGLRLDEVDSWRARGVADPDSDETRNFMIDLTTGDIVGGAEVP